MSKALMQGVSIGLLVVAYCVAGFTLGYMASETRFINECGTTEPSVVDVRQGAILLECNHY